MLTARQIVDAFGYASLAGALGLPGGTVSAWKSRGAIPQPYWRAIVAEAKKRRLAEVTYSALEHTARPHRRRKKLVAEARP